MAEPIKAISITRLCKKGRRRKAASAPSRGQALYGTVRAYRKGAGSGRAWIEVGWADFMLRSDRTIRRYWALVR
jgi:hypothetical protein